MKIRFEKKYLYVLVFALTLIFSAISEISNFNKLLLLLLVLSIVAICCKPIRRQFVDKKYTQVISIASVTVILETFVLLFQFMFCVKGIQNMRTAIAIYSMILFGLITIFIWRKLLQDIDLIVFMISMFIIIFSLVCIVSEVGAGISVARNSAFGNVSKNFTAAVSYLGIPLLLYYIYTKGKNVSIRMLCFWGIALATVNVIISGSRTSAVIIICCFASLFFLRMSFKQRVKYISLAVLALAIIFVVSTRNAAIKNTIDRALLGFSSSSDTDRAFLRKAALLKFSKYHVFQKIFGNGAVAIYVSQNETLPHNFFLELLLSLGALGTIVYVVALLRIMILTIFKTDYYKRFFCLQAGMMFLLTAFFQPFFSTSFICGFLVYVTLSTILFDESSVV